jgi:hypothetical protein
MQFKLVLFGALLLAAGLIAYTSIPNVHRTLVLQTLAQPSPEPIQVPAGGLVETTDNLTLVSGRQNYLQVNLTVLSSPGQGSPIVFQAFQKNQTGSCLDTRQHSYLLNQEVSNQSLQAPIFNPGQYCFVFDNEGSNTAKRILIATSISSSLEQIQITNDGEMNIIGLVAGGIGFLILAAGFLKKTVIPWE